MRVRMTAVLAVLALGAAAGLAACGDDDDGSGAGGAYGGGEPTRTDEATQTETEQTTTQPPAPPTIVLRDGRPVGGVRELGFDAGEKVRFEVRSNVADEVHVHGYDIDRPVPAGGTASFAFPADIEGIFEVESHESGEQLAELRIEP